MQPLTDRIIAQGLGRYLAAQLARRPAARAFFRLSGFSTGAYAALLDDLSAGGWRLGATPLEVRSIDPIPGHEDRVREPGRSATWYRNTVKDGQALVLIQNRLSTDAQSLKDLFPVTELSLSRDGLPQLIDAACTRFQLADTDREALVEFVRRLPKVMFEPQLRDLTGFLVAVDAQLDRQPGTSVARAIVLALPHLGLFRCLALEEQLNTPRGDRLLAQVYEAARMGSKVLDERSRGEYLGRLADARFDDDESIGGLSAAKKREQLRRFIEGELRGDHDALLQVFQIEWREIQLVITARSRPDRKARLGRAAEQLAAAASDGQEPDEAVADVIAELRAGREPDADAMERALTELEARLPRPARTELRRLVKTRTRKHGDFLVGLAALAVELLQPLQGELRAGTQLAVAPDLDAASEPKHLPDALAAFRAHFGGVEQALPEVDWRLDPLWHRLAAPGTAAPEGDDEPERGRVARVELPFRVTVVGPDGAELARASLVWQHRSDSPAAATALTLAAERAALAQGRPRVPVFNSCGRTEEVGDLDIRRPIQSLGVWYEQPGDLRALLEGALERRAKPQAWAAIEQALGQLEVAWARFVDAAAAGGILAADTGGLLTAYEGLLRTAATELRTSQEASAGYRVLGQAWVVGTRHFDGWAMVPLLHPLKLLWWRERARYIRGVIRHLLDPARPAQVVDGHRYRRDLAATYGSSGFPPSLALPAGEGLPVQRFLPSEEADGYELYFPHQERGEPVGLDGDSLADDEARIAAERAVEGLTAVVQDYIETYPFVRDGLEIVLFECRNGALPGLLVEQLTAAAARRGWQLRLSVLVHTTDRGAPLFGRVSAWVAAEHPAAGRRRNDYFPPVSLKVLQCDYDELLRSREDADLVILADVLSERGQRVASELELHSEGDTQAEGFLPTYRAQQEPFQQGELFRRLLLSQRQQPTVARLFLLTQHAAVERRPVEPGAAAHLYRELTLVEWERELGRLHDHFNWVICYDQTIDRFLLQSAFPDKVQVIRYSLGLGPKRQHNLTVSSSHRAQAVVERRLASRLAQMLPGASATFLGEVAAQLVARAKQVSGDIVLRAAGPGAFLNELIGLVTAKYATERRRRRDDPAALTTWILLDDFEHWFGGGKFPDLLFVGIGQGANGGLRLHLEILEAKCVGQLSFAAEASDAEEQVRRGVHRLTQAFAPGHRHLDALYWYDQLYRAVAGNLEVELTQQPLWDLFREGLHAGTFEAEVEGHAWAFCYDGQVGTGTGPEERPIAGGAAGAPDTPLIAHHYGRDELCHTLRQLIEDGGAPTPAAMWARPAPPPPASPDTPPPPPKGPDTPPPPSSVQSVAPPPPQPAGAAPAADRQGPPQPAPTQPGSPAADEQAWLKAKARDLERALRHRGVHVLAIDPAQADVGPSVVRFKLRLGPNETLKKAQSVAADLARDLALEKTPIIANVLGTSFVGVDVPRERPQVIELRPLLERLGTPAPAELPIIVGVSPDGTLVTDDIAEFPHLLVAGVTNSGKSVFLRGLLLSLMTQYRPGDLELMIVDPKRTDFTFFNRSPYLRGGKVIVDQKEAREALLELVRGEMPRRQELIAERSMKIKQFNLDYPGEALPPIVALIDEYALLVSQMDRKEREAFEQDLSILAAAARSVGIHLVVATQRPSADVITSTLKANLGTQIAFRVATAINSRVVIDEAGAENLLGRGDMLFRPVTGELARLQAPFMPEAEMRAYLAELHAR